jgi:hypothetical protein
MRSSTPKCDASIAPFQSLVEVHACGKPRPRNGIFQSARNPSGRTSRSAGSQLPWKLGLAALPASVTLVSRPIGVNSMPMLPASVSGSVKESASLPGLASTRACMPLPASAKRPASGSSSTLRPRQAIGAESWIARTSEMPSDSSACFQSTSAGSMPSAARSGMRISPASSSFAR